ncbi:MAG: hypothetical protein EA403_00200 [Spirochaetaceae bacterium]|nr:MAG: hypothetical protein EA403_00200 [Spirochaetaceae bacterium]
MRTQRLVLTALFFAVAALAAGQQTALVRATSGKVEVLQAGQWSPLAVGAAIPIGATVSTGFGSTATVEIGPAIMEIRPLTRMRLDELAEREGVVSAELYLPVGRVRAEVRRMEGLESEFRLRSTQATAAVRGTSFDFDGRDLRVLTGRVQLINQFQQSVQVSGGGVAEASDTGEIASGTALREMLSAAVPSATAFIEEAVTTFLQRRDEIGTGTIHIKWGEIEETPQ